MSKRLRTATIVLAVSVLSLLCLVWLVESGRLVSTTAEPAELAILGPSQNYARLSARQIVRQHSRKLKLSSLLQAEGISSADTVAVLGASGAFQTVSLAGQIEITTQQSINYLPPAGQGQKIVGLRAIMVDPPELGITQTYGDTVSSLEQGEPVLVLFVDGFSYEQYLHARQNGFAPFLRSLPEARPALSVYQPVTNAGFAAIITGQPPGINGVHSRSQRQLNVPSIFGRALELGQQAVLIEGDIQILDTEVAPRLNLDATGNGLTDEEVFVDALAAMAEQPDLMLVHFHGVDDKGHAHGPLATETLDRIRRIDGFLAELVGGWDGRVIIVSDHGMHETEDGGSHGQLRYEDLVVPYLVIAGGR